MCALQSKLAIKPGGVQKHSKKGKKSLKAIALMALEAAPTEEDADKSPARSPSPTRSSPENAEDEQEPGAAAAKLGSSSLSQQADDASPAPGDSPTNSSDAERQQNASPVSSMPDGAPLEGSEGLSDPGINNEGAFEDSIDRQGVPSTTFKRLMRRAAPPDADSGSGPEAAGSLQGLTPSKNTPSKATPSKRLRETACSSPAANSPVVGVEHFQGLEGGVTEGTPGKRRRSFLPQSNLPKDSSQVRISQRGPL